jgi:hypothetical protein
VILAMDFIETVTLTGQRQYILAAIHHASRRVRVLGTTAHPTHAWVTQAIRNLVMDLEDDAGLGQVRFLIRDRDAKYPVLINEILAGNSITTVLTGVRVPRMNAITERWVKTLRAELLDRTLMWNETHLRHVLGEYERYYNQHRTHRSLTSAAPLRSLPDALGPDQTRRLTVHRQDRLGGIIHEYRHASDDLHGRIFRHSQPPVLHDHRRSRYRTHTEVRAPSESCFSMSEAVRRAG